MILIPIMDQCELFSLCSIEEVDDGCVSGVKVELKADDCVATCWYFA